MLKGAEKKKIFSVLNLHWQLDHHANNPLSAGSKVKAFRQTDPAGIKREFKSNPHQTKPAARSSSIGLKINVGGRRAKEPKTLVKFNFF